MTNEVKDVKQTILQSNNIEIKHHFKQTIGEELLK